MSKVWTDIYNIWMSQSSSQLRDGNVSLMKYLWRPRPQPSLHPRHRCASHSRPLNNVDGGVSFRTIVGDDLLFPRSDYEA